MWGKGYKYMSVPRYQKGHGLEKKKKKKKKRRKFVRKRKEKEKYVKKCEKCSKQVRISSQVLIVEIRVQKVVFGPNIV